MSYMHEESRAVIAESLRSAAARNLIDKAILVDFVDQDCLFDPHALRIWHDELESVLSALTLLVPTIRDAQPLTAIYRQIPEEGDSPRRFW